MRICPLCRKTYESPELRFCAEDGQLLIELATLAAAAQPPAAVAGNAVKPSASPFSASLALVFFAHHFLEIKTDYTTSSFIYYVYRGGTNVPCQTNIQVDLPDLTNHLLAIALWYLSENNCLRFTPGADQGLITAETPLLIESNPSNQAKIPGLEFDLLEIIKHSAPAITVETVVKLFLQKKTYVPAAKIFNRLTQWIIQLGYGQPVASSGLSIHLCNPENLDFEFVPDCRRIAGNEPAAQSIQGNWLKFQSQRPEIFHLLLNSVKRAVLAQTVSRRGNFNRL